MPTSIEFVKHYHAHLGSICSFVMSFDEQKLVTTCMHDSMIKVFDVLRKSRIKYIFNKFRVI